MSINRRLSVLSVALAAASLSGLGLAQTEFETGTIQAEIGARNISAFTYATEVPADAAEGIEDERQRAVMERVAGTTVHSASFMHREAMTMGSIVLVPETIYVTLSTRTGHPDGDSVDSLLIRFSLDPVTLELGDEADTEVRYYPVGSSYEEYYALTEGTLTLDSLTVVDAHTMSLSGTVSGVLTRQFDFDIVHNPDDTLPIQASFTIEQVSSSDLAFELVTDN